MNVIRMTILLSILNACSLWVDLAPTNSWDQDDDLGQLQGNETVAGIVLSSGEMMGGEMMGGEMMGGEMMGGDRAGEPIPSGVMAGEWMGGVAQGGSGVAGDPMLGGTLMGGVQTGGVPIGGEPVFLEFIDHIPNGECLIHAEGSQCLLKLDEIHDQNCQEYQNTISKIGVDRILQNESCASEIPDIMDVNDAKNLINYFRKSLNINNLDINTSTSYAKCAIITDGLKGDGEWNTSDTCFDFIDSSFLEPDSSVTRIVGNWRAFDLFVNLFSSVRDVPLYYRHLLLNPQIDKLRLGIYKGASCLGFNQRNISVPLPITFYPGVGYIPIDKVQGGNHKGERPAWSIEILDSDVSNINLEVTQIFRNTGERQIRSIRTLAMDTEHPNIIGWHLDVPENVNDIFEVSVSWSQANLVNTLKLYTTFVDCGLSMPLNCDPTRNDQCIVQGHNCMYFHYENDNPNWYCQRSGPLPLNTTCTEYSGSCAGETLCITADDNLPSSCTQRCVLDPNSPSSCATLCEEYFSLNEITDALIGICIQP